MFSCHVAVNKNSYLSVNCDIYSFSYYLAHAIFISVNKHTIRTLETKKNIYK